MKSTLLLSALLVATFFFVSPSTYAQTESANTTSVTKEKDLAAESQLNEERRENADALKKEYKAKAKEARRVEQDASDASKQTRKAVRMEKQAQKARSNAEKQNKKAKKAAEKSDNN